MQQNSHGEEKILNKGSEGQGSGQLAPGGAAGRGGRSPARRTWLLRAALCEARRSFWICFLNSKIKSRVKKPQQCLQKLYASTLPRTWFDPCDVVMGHSCTPSPTVPRQSVYRGSQEPGLRRGPSPCASPHQLGHPWTTTSPPD